MELQLLIESKMLKRSHFFSLKHTDVFILLINVKMPKIVAILTFMSRINFMLSSDAHEKSFITSWSGFQPSNSNNFLI